MRERSWPQIHSDSPLLLRGTYLQSASPLCHCDACSQTCVGDPDLFLETKDSAVLACLPKSFQSLSFPALLFSSPSFSLLLKRTALLCFWSTDIFILCFWVFLTFHASFVQCFDWRDKFQCELNLPSWSGNSWKSFCASHLAYNFQPSPIMNIAVLALIVLVVNVLNIPKDLLDLSGYQLFCPLSASIQNDRSQHDWLTFYIAFCHISANQTKCLSQGQ